MNRIFYYQSFFMNHVLQESLIKLVNKYLPKKNKKIEKF